MTDGFSLITASSSSAGGGRSGSSSFFLFPLSPFPFPAACLIHDTREAAGGCMKSASIRMGAAASMDFIGGARDQRQQTELKVVHSSHCSEHIVTVQCVTAVCVCAGLMYAGGRWCWCSPWISYICPAGARPNPAHRMCQLALIPYNVPTIHVVFRAMLQHSACQRALWRGAIGCGGISQCISCTITPHRRC